MSIKLYKDIGYRGGIQAVTFRGNQPSSKTILALRNFNMGANGKIIKSAISWKGLAAEQNEWTFGTRGIGTSYVGYPWGQVIWVQFGVIRCTLQISDVKIFKGTTPTVFIQFQPNLMGRMYSEKIQAITFLSICQTFKGYGTLKII